MSNIFKVAEVRKLGIYAYNLRFGADGKLWFSSISANTVMSFDIATSRLETHFFDDSYCAFCFDGKRGVIGTMDGRVLYFSTQTLVLHPVAACAERSAIGALDIDEHGESLFFACGWFAFQASLDGRILGHWQYKVVPFTIRYAGIKNKLWLACDGLEVIDIPTGLSKVWGQNRVCPYVDIAEAPDGNVACFGGDIDVFSPDGELLTSVPGDYNCGFFDRKGRLLVKEVTREIPDDVTIREVQTTIGKISVISTCDSFAMDSTGNLVVASHGGKLYVFNRR